jgi:hypothetical protein
MNFFQILGVCDTDFVAILRIVRWVVSIICFAVPIILIILCILDIAKIVTAGNIDDKLKKETLDKIVTRVVFAVIIFLVPTIVGLLFKLIPVKDADKNVNIQGATWSDCWKEAGE